MAEPKKSNLGRRERPARRSIDSTFREEGTAPPAPPVQSPKESKSSDNVTLFNLRMDSDLHWRLKVQSLKEKRTMKEIVEACVRKYLEDNEDEYGSI